MATPTPAPASATEEKPRTRKPRLIVRIAGFLVAHSVPVSILCCVAAFVALLLLPVLAKTTYVSENALMPGSANAMFSAHNVVEANRFVKDIMDRSTKSAVVGVEIPRLIRQHMSDVGAEVYYHTFAPHKNLFNPVHFFSSTPNTMILQSNNTCSSEGVNSVGIIRAPRGDGKETIVLVTPYNPENMGPGEALSLGLAFSVFSLLSQATWLAKDIIWLAADSRYGEYTSVAAWLKDYHNLGFFVDSGEAAAVGMCLEPSTSCESDTNFVEGMEFNVFRRAGTMAAALVLNVVEREETDDTDILTLYAEASNGQMPNLDLINVVHYLAEYRLGLRVHIGRISSLIGSAWLKLIGDLLHGVGKFTALLNPKWKVDITSSDYADDTATLASSMYYQALGVPTGSHGAFRDYQVDAITLELSPKSFLNNKNGQSAFLLKSGRLIEGVVRSVNNLLEKFHQSFFLYFLTAPNKFVSVGVYMIAFALLVAPLPIVAAALFSGSRLPTDAPDQMGSNAGADEVADRPWKWVHSAKVVFLIHIWAATAALLPYLISQIPNITSTESMLAWVGLSITILLVFYLVMGSPYSNLRDEWKVLKAVTIAVAFIGLGLMSIINFSTAQIGAVLLVPMSLMVRPLRNSQLAVSLRTTLLACNLTLAVVGFPPVALMILKGMFEGFGGVGFGDFWQWAEFLWVWNSATYLYLLLVHLPCWVLCIHILLYP